MEPMRLVLSKELKDEQKYLQGKPLSIAGAYALLTEDPLSEQSGILYLRALKAMKKQGARISAISLELPHYLEAEINKIKEAGTFKGIEKFLGFRFPLAYSLKKDLPVFCLEENNLVLLAREIAERDLREGTKSQEYIQNHQERAEAIKKGLEKLVRVYKKGVVYLGSKDLVT